MNLTNAFNFINEDDGSQSLIDPSELDSQAKAITARLTLVVDEHGNKLSASTEFMKLNHNSSPAYARVVLYEVLRLSGIYLAEHAGTWEMPIILRNINNLLLAYRIVRPVPNMDAAPDTEGER